MNIQILLVVLILIVIIFFIKNRNNEIENFSGTCTNISTWEKVKRAAQSATPSGCKRNGMDWSKSGRYNCTNASGGSAGQKIVYTDRCAAWVNGCENCDQGVPPPSAPISKKKEDWECPKWRKEIGCQKIKETKKALPWRYDPDPCRESCPPLPPPPPIPGKCGINVGDTSRRKCPRRYSPVTCPDGNTYNNDCEASKNGCEGCESSRRVKSILKCQERVPEWENAWWGEGWRRIYTKENPWGVSVCDPKSKKPVPQPPYYQILPRSASAPAPIPAPSPPAPVPQPPAPVPQPPAPRSDPPPPAPVPQPPIQLPKPNVTNFDAPTGQYSSWCSPNQDQSNTNCNCRMEWKILLTATVNGVTYKSLPSDSMGISDNCFWFWNPTVYFNIVNPPQSPEDINIVLLTSRAGENNWYYSKVAPIKLKRNQRMRFSGATADFGPKYES